MNHARRGAVPAAREAGRTSRGPCHGRSRPAVRGAGGKHGGQDPPWHTPFENTP